MSTDHSSGRRWSLVFVSLCLGAAVACGSEKAPSAPTPPPVTTSAVQVRAANNQSGPMEAGQTRQLVAMATQSTGTSTDVTQQATWTTSTPSVATVSTTGLLTALAEGNADIGATYQGVRGALGVDVQPIRCAVTISPASAAYGPFGGGGSVQVQVSAPSCRWTALSTARWLPFAFDPGVAGSGSFGYTAPANSTTDTRTADIVVTTSTGETATHAVTVNRTTGCSYVTDPEEAVYSAAGGTGQFNVITTPGNCQWNLVNGLESLGVRITQGWSGTGNALVRYSVQAHTRDVDADGYLEIAGLSGQNPNGRHHIVIRKR
jgi:hypothetical protein